MTVNVLKHDRIDVSEGIDVNRRSELKIFYVCHYWYFLVEGLVAIIYLLGLS